MFDLWIEAEAAEDGIAEQSISQYRQVWRTELQTSKASRHLLAMGR
ncbi:hypothetical protein [Mycobacterium sp. ACS1612]|nr:hypothetical protein [Mycobacterium sp. ACS1612]